MAEEIQGLSRLIGRVKRLAADVRDAERPMRASGEVLRRSVEQNFRAQGRPAKWPGLAAATISRRRRGKGRGRPQILIDTARLKNSIGYRVVSEGVEVGTNVKYARRQHFGFPGGTGPGHSKTPARPFLVVQGEDIETIAGIFRRHIGR
ncbi:MAG: phage virion morphogenesis protein [Pyrinomonadaceae bacterium]